MYSTQKVKILFVAAALAVASLVSGVATAADLLKDIQKRGELRVGMSTFVPWAMRDTSGKLIGFEIDVATKVAEDIGVKIKFVPTAWSGIIPALIAKKFDVIIGGMSITPSRNLTVNFTTPYAHSGQQMAANRKLAGKFRSKERFNSSSVTITCRRGATPCNTAQAIFPKAKLRRFDDEAQAYQEVLNGNAHAVISSAPEPGFWAEAHPKKIYMPFAGENLTSGDEAIALRKGDPDALNFFNNWVLVRTSDGWLKERHDHWFKSQAAWKHLIPKAQ